MIDKKTGKVVKTIMRDFTINEIATVDRGAQAPARMVITKRHIDAKPDPVALYKVLPKPKKDEEKNDFVSRFMGNEGAKKEFPDQKQRAAVANRTYRASRTEKRLALTSATNGHTHAIVGAVCHGESFAEEIMGRTTFNMDQDGRMHSHNWMLDDSGNIVVAEENGHTHTIAVVKNEGLTDGELALVLSEEVTASEPEAAEPNGTSGEDGMKTTQTKAADANKAAGTQDPDPKAQVAELTKRLEKAEKVADLDDAQKAHYKALKGEEADKFLALDADGRAAVMKNLADANPVVWKDDATGTEYRKNDDPRLIELAKQSAKDRETIKQQQEAAKAAEFQKRAGELSHLPGTTEDHLALVKAIDALPDAEKDKAMKALLATNSQMSKAFRTLGTKAGGDPNSDLQKIADDLRKADPKLTDAQAFAKALETPQGMRAWESEREAELANS